MLNSIAEAFRPTTPVDIILDGATNEINSYQDVNWQIVSHLCDTVNSREDGAKEAIRAVRRRFKSRNIAVQLRTLLILQSLFDNCGAKLRVQLASKEFLKDYEKFYLAPTTDSIVKYRLYELLDGWTQALQGEPSLIAIPNLYAKLFRDGPPPQVNLPTPLPPSNPAGNFVATPVGTPSQEVSNPVPSQSRPSLPPRQPSNSLHPLPSVDQGLEVMRNTCEMFSESLTYASVEDDLSKNELIQEFRTKCQKLQNDVGRYLSTEQSEETTAALLAVNGEFLNAFKLYDDLVEQYQLHVATSLSRAETMENNPDHAYNPDAENGGSSSNYVNPFTDANQTNGKDKGKKPLLEEPPVNGGGSSGRASPVPPPPES